MYYPGSVASYDTRSGNTLYLLTYLIIIKTTMALVWTATALFVCSVTCRNCRPGSVLTDCVCCLLYGGGRPSLTLTVASRMSVRLSVHHRCFAADWLLGVCCCCEFCTVYHQHITTDCCTGWRATVCRTAAAAAAAAADQTASPRQPLYIITPLLSLPPPCYDAVVDRF